MSSQTVNLFALLSRRIDALSDMAAVRSVSRARRIRDIKRLTKLVESPARAVKIFADGNERGLKTVRFYSSRSRKRPRES